MDSKVQELTLKRLAIAEGHLKKVIAMVREGCYCPNVIHQSKAVQSALKNVDGMVLQGHLYGCVVKDIKDGKGEKVLEELVELYKRT
ncbi:MAG: hypothetical protein A3D24_00360 [Candidatus Blackburnbacteria bacterium RIFCSPHIGHO2_02_FULL_39_13]|uniref:Transcriptional regulator n=1 Tax=Candidatus Blackburnbacteria bacterium RIFCSPLOWO2_01_FULL_40_20 TaxID=1797519 RepID=A0A1G1VFS9_9BACT|nr:MAG: hypothetical protein UT38_C0017G0035 [Microgenomates group bacterium GW2011_GWA2_39_19]OGY07533.1 MAG: hypothetical protein A2694_04725 [Candidatus Blackburnbacteria bacterium RIFCSPHIGHO2_01_FULL_40_17]OGY08615.1 MAG: hypothetical protein A3D24_00360 [Candidatus Blackburnbacteria bacterium RIFCSPHIGHO2_02_FULL_39_13]OGY14250.1 MAG: hypothetical protein A3A77_02120 [Candidatus Blackburnbacteria bacterium RIFCSPLOWO2_01_FULL_40_20]OGY14577.1 MAG: hypothetical protein A3I52_00315 [Candida